MHGSAVLYQGHTDGAGVGHPTDPFRDIKLHDMAPLFLLRGESFDQMTPK